MPLIDELKRRNVFKVGVAYVVTAWLLLQLTEVLVGLLGLPENAGKYVILLLVIGFPVALFFAWAFELTPEGIKKEKDVDRSQSITRQTARTLDRTIIYALVLALAWFSWDKFIADPQRDQADLESVLRETTRDQVDEDATEAPATERSIAVLPFVNISEEAGNEYFADGLSEELLNTLVKIPDLRVAARTSSFSFKGKDIQISDIAQQLNVSHILEGSVRKSGDRVRITAQLIKAGDGFHLWSETFDRTLDDIFAVQDEIASRVVSALQITLLDQPARTRKVNPDAYAMLLKGLYFLQQREREGLEKSARILLQAIELEPDYADAWQLLAMVYYSQISRGFKTRGEGYALAMDASERAISLDPELGVAWAGYSHLKKNLDWDWDAAQTALSKALQLDPKMNIIQNWNASLAQTLGRLDESINIYQQAQVVDPINMSTYSSLGILYRKTRRLDDAIEMFSKQIELRPQYHWAHLNLGKVYLFKGDATQALREIEKNPPNIYRELGLVMAYSTLGREAEAQVILQKMVMERGEQNPAWIAEAFAWRGENDLAFEWLEKAYVQKDIGLAYILNSRVLEALSDDPRWVELLRKLDLLGYWQAMPAAYGGPAKPVG